jgi:hypothetical protein
MKSAVESGYLARTPCMGMKLPRAVRREARDALGAHVPVTGLTGKDALVFVRPRAGQAPGGGGAVDAIAAACAGTAPTTVAATTTTTANPNR